MNELLAYLKQLPKPWAYHIMARFNSRTGWWELEARLTPRSNREGSDISTTFFRWSELPLDVMATAMIPEIDRYLESVS